MSAFLPDPNDGTSENPCDSTYFGSHSFSEVEVAAFRDFVNSLGGGMNRGHGGNIALYIDYHTYGEQWIYPFGYKSWDNETTINGKPVDRLGDGRKKGFRDRDRQLLVSNVCVYKL